MQANIPPALAEDRAAVQEASPRRAAQLAKVADRINALAVQFDADKNASLSPDEQAALVKYLGEKFGPPWADRIEPFLRSADTNGNRTIEAGEWKRAIAALGPSPVKAAEKQTFMVAMSDGVRLATDVYLPAGDGPFPVVFTRTPYSRLKAAGMAPALTAGGFALVAQDMRGRFDSEGENLPFVGCGWAGHQDGAESVAWIHQQKWANGKIGTVGGSAGGITQNLLAGAAPQGLTAQYITVAAASMYHDATYVGGALRKCQVENWQRTNRFDPRAGEIMRAHPAYDDYWKDFDTRLKFEVMNTPAVHVGGW
ncbi:MAG TPA: CocE/NonD family hydrolase, partial [Pirellulales bacterium]|nr:CocE/NonD family hydrolase [Pirellulales bacterium]